jgi:hypothetical protein
MLYGESGKVTACIRFGLIMPLILVAMLIAIAQTHKPQSLPTEFWNGSDKWELAQIKNGIELPAEDVGMTECLTHQVYVHQGEADAYTRKILRHELNHVITDCENIEQFQDIDVLFDEISDGFEDLMADPRNAELRAFLENR